MMFLMFFFEKDRMNYVNFRVFENDGFFKSELLDCEIVVKN